MIEYVAFLRAVNVGKANQISMSDARKRLEGLGLREVSSYRLSGNLIFQAEETDALALRGSIETELRRSTGNSVEVFLRTLGELRDMVSLDPFRDYGMAEANHFVTFFQEEPSTLPPLPLISPNGDVQVILIRHRAAFSLGFRLKGRFGAPNAFLEKTLKLSATTRNWTTILGIAGNSGEWASRSRHSQ